MKTTCFYFCTWKPEREVNAFTLMSFLSLDLLSLLYSSNYKEKFSKFLWLKYYVSTCLKLGKEKPTKTNILLVFSTWSSQSTSTHTTSRSCPVRLKLWSDNVNWNSYVYIQPQTNYRLQHKALGFVGFIPQSSTVMSIVLSWILKYRFGLLL